MPHERGLLPVPPSEFLTLLSPIPKLASAARRQPLANPSTETPANPLTLRHLTTALRPPPECLALLWKNDARVPLHLCSRRAVQLPLHSRKSGKSRKDA